MRASPYFRGLSEAWLRELGRGASRRDVAAGEELETDGDPAAARAFTCSRRVRSAPPATS
jgi:hypothetical protein